MSKPSASRIAGADLGERVLGADAAGEAGGDAQQVFDGHAVAVALLGGLRVLDRQRGVRGDGGEHVELGPDGQAARQRLVERQDAEQGVVLAVQRNEQAVLGPPRLGSVAGACLGDPGDHAVAPVVVLVANDVGAVAGEARVEHLLPRRARVRGAHERGAALVGGAVHDADLEVVEGGTVEVDHDDPPAQRVRDRASDRLEHRLQAPALAHRVRDVEQPTQMRKRSWVTRRGVRRGLLVGHHRPYRPVASRASLSAVFAAV